MESTHIGWWRRHGWTVGLLLAAFGMSFAIRTIWTYPVVAQWGPLFTYAGGSDSFYHSRVMAYIALNHTNLVLDPLLKYPFGSINPREPLFDWMNGVLGVAFAPFFGGNPVVAGSWFLDLQAPLWAALGVFPVYLIGREIDGRRVGLVAALIYPFLSGNIDSTIFGYANYLSFYTFIILVVVYSYIRTVKAVGSRRWVTSYRQPRSIVAGLKGFLATERSAVKWAVFTGVSLGALALAWQGFTYAIVVIGIGLLVTMLVERIRRVDSFGLYVATWITGLVGFPMAVPYYVAQHQFHVWFDLPLILYFGLLGLLLPFLMLRDVPWVLSIPLLGGLVVVAGAILNFVNPTYFTNIVTGQGYFVKTLIYSTVAEAQSPSIDQLIVAYGVVTFFLAFVGLALLLYLLAHQRFRRVHVIFLVFAILSLYLPFSASKFFELGSPIFALLPAVALVRALDIAGFPELRRTVASLSDRRSQFAAFRKSFKVRHVVVLALVIGLVLPNVWIAVDAGIPGNTKSQFAAQVGATLPPWLQLNTSNPAGYYFGAAGTSLDTPNQYDSAGYNWLAQQDTNVPPAQRPAFVSWWDYGFQAIAQGNHPSVADNFQNGIDPAGQFLLSQNESQAIAVLTATLLTAEATRTGQTYLPASLNQVLARDGVDLSTLHDLMANTSADYSLVVAHPERYLPVNPSTLTDENAMYLAVTYFLASSLTLSSVSQVYNDVQAYTGWSIAYAMTDSRLFPFSGQSTGIFYAPADLTGRVISSAGIPTTYFQVIVNTTQGNFPAGQVPAGVGVLSYQIAYLPAFYNTMIYRTYIGYNGTQAGLGPGIPGLSGSNATISAPIMPGWMLQHFQVVYKTAYYCPEKNVSAGSGCFVATNTPTAEANANRTGGGTADTSPAGYFGATSSGGESILRYYAGQPLSGRVILPGGAPVAGAQVTIDDSWGIPHMTTTTGPDGSFSLILPPGNDTLNVSTGSLNGVRQQGSDVLGSYAIQVPDAIGLSYHAPTLVQTFTVRPVKVQGFVYWDTNGTGIYAPAVDALVPGSQVIFWGTNLTTIRVTTDTSGSFLLPNTPPGVYHESVLYEGQNYSIGSVTAISGTVVNATAGLKPGTLAGTVRDTTGLAVPGARVTLSNASGVVATVASNATGHYLFRTIGVGNYSLTALGPYPGWRSAGVGVSVASPGTKLTSNLTVGPAAAVSVSVSLGGTPAANLPVRLTPVEAFNRTASPIQALVTSSGDSTIVTTSGTGTATTYLPSGSYAVYVSGYFGSTLYAAMADLTVGGPIPATAALTLVPASSVTGSVRVPGPSSNATERTAVLAYSSGGGEALVWAAANGSYSLNLPAGSYSMLALSGSTSSGSAISAGLGSAVVPTTAPLVLSEVSAVSGTFTVGATLSNGTNFPANGALVQVLAGSTGPAIPGFASANGSVTVYAPSVLPGSATYCVRVSALGFVPKTECGISPNGLTSLGRFPLAIANVSVTMTVVGLPSGTSVTVSFTALGAPAVDRTISGGPTFSLTLSPGQYGVGARATTAGGVVYLPSSYLTTEIPLGATYSNLTLYLVPQYLSKGTLTLPSGVLPGAVNLTLSSSLLKESVNGTQFTTGFMVPPGTYSVYASATHSGTTYTDLRSVSIASNGTVWPAIDLLGPGVDLQGVLVNDTGARVPLSTNATLVGAGGAEAIVPVTGGNFSLSLPANSVYRVFANGTALSPGPNGSFYQDWTAGSGTDCSVSSSSATCSVPLTATTVPVWLNGTVSSPGITGPLSGTLELVGPYPSTAVQSIPISNSAFSALVLPGAYDLYASSGPVSAARAAFAGALVLPFEDAPLALTLQPTYTATLQVSPPSSGSSGIGPVTVTLRDSLGHRLVFSGLGTSSAVTIALPTGTYRASATAEGTFDGVATAANASDTLIVSGGNVGADLALQYAQISRVAGTVVGTSSATVAGGGSATFAFSVQNTGNVPVTITPVGSPAYWTFNFSFDRVTLAPGASASGEVRLTVPAGTAVAHPGVILSFENGTGATVGTVSPNPVVNVVGYYGVGVGRASQPVQVGPDSVLVPFYVLDTGNQRETVALSVVDAGRLQGLGWSSRITSAGEKTAAEANLTAGQNATYYVLLNATGSVFVPPGSVSVRGDVVNSSGTVSASGTIGMPSSTLGFRSPGTPITVVGPSISGGPPAIPDWVVAVLAFVPAILLAVGIFAYRWWRTRRWTHR